MSNDRPSSFAPRIISSETDLSSALMAAIRSELQATSRAFIEKVIADFRDEIERRAAELVARAAIRVTSHVSPGNEAEIQVSVRIPIQR